MKTIQRLYILLIVVALIGDLAGLIVSLIDSGVTVEPANQFSPPALTGKALNRELAPPTGSGSARKSVTTFSINETLENLGKMTFIVIGVWGIEKLARNKRRPKFIPTAGPLEPASGWAKIAHPQFDLLSKWMDES